MDISAQNGFGGTTTDTNLVIYSPDVEKVSAIAFDGTFTLVKAKHIDIFEIRDILFFLSVFINYPQKFPKHNHMSLLTTTNVTAMLLNLFICSVFSADIAKQQMVQKTVRFASCK